MSWRRRAGRAAGAALLLVAVGTAEAEAQVAARSIPRGATLTERDIRWPDAPRDAAGVGPGWVARRVIAEGEPLREPAVGRPQLVRAGEEVAVEWVGEGITIRLIGTAMGSAVAGERVLVRIDARRRLEGVAAGPGRVRINGDNR